MVGVVRLVFSVFGLAPCSVRTALNLDVRRSFKDDPHAFGIRLGFGANSP